MAAVDLARSGRGSLRIMNAQKILITGASGHIGTLLTRSLLRSDAELILWLNAESAGQFTMKRAALEAALASHHLVSKDLDRLSYAWGNLTDNRAFDDVCGDGIDTIVHLASQTKFNVSKEAAENVNIAGSQRVLEFAGRCRKLSNFIFVSSIYASGLKEGTLAERPLPRADFANNYEWSKWQAEQKLINDYSALPWQIVRLATVIADDEEGNVTHQNAFHNTLKLFYYGLLSLLPGHPATPLYFISGRLATDALEGTIFRPTPHQIYNVCQSVEGAVCLADLIDLSFACFKQSPDFARRRIMPPLFASAADFKVMTEASAGFRDEVLKQALASIEPFARQLFVRKEVLNDHTLCLLDGQPTISSRDLIEASVTRLVASKWGHGEHA
jgi:nucleoside-diphosphate-sugar epimerase